VTQVVEPPATSAPLGAGPHPPGPPWAGGAGPLGPSDSPRRHQVALSNVWEPVGSGLSALAFVWVVFTVAGVSVRGAFFGFLVAWFCTFMVVYGVVCRRQHGTVVMKDRLATVMMWNGALVAFVPLAAVIIYVVVRGAPVALAHFPRFFVGDMSQIGSNNPAVGAGAAIVGTVEEVALSMALTVPLGVLTATYLVDATGAFARVVSAVVDAMTGAPAIIAGLFIYLLVVAPLKTSGKSGLAAALALAVMMLPIVTRAAQEVIAVVPGSLREAALALGAPRWRVVVQVVLPTARAGLMTAVILGVARVAGETAPVLFNAGGNYYYNWNPFHGQQDNLPLRIYELIQQPSPTAVRVAWGVSFVLVLVVLILFVVARVAGRSTPGRRRRSALLARVSNRGSRP